MEVRSDVYEMIRQIISHTRNTVLGVMRIWEYHFFLWANSKDMSAVGKTVHQE